MVSTLDKENVAGYYDPETRVIYITYSGVLGADASTNAYDWLAEVIDELGIENIYGEVFDFTKVRQFQPENLVNARKNSRKLNLRVNIHDTPVAMVVRDAVQREILRGPMRNMPENKRKRIVESIDEAFAFFKEWHAENTQP